MLPSKSTSRGLTPKLRSLSILVFIIAEFISKIFGFSDIEVSLNSCESKLSILAESDLSS